MSSMRFIHIPAVLFLITGVGLSSTSSANAQERHFSSSEAVAQRRCKGPKRSRRADCDPDRDLGSNRVEKIWNTDSSNPDTDGDFILDGAEVNELGTDPLSPDSDQDGVIDSKDSAPLNPSLPGAGGGNSGSSGSGGGTSSNCDANGNTSDFGIPVGSSGNINTGQSSYQISCARCHAGIDKGAGKTYLQLKTAVFGPPMNLTALSNQTLFDLTAYLNRSSCRTVDNGGGGTQPTPTPIPPPTPTSTSTTVRGQFVFASTCSGCHNRASEFAYLSRSKLDEAIADKPEMSGISLTAQQYTDLFAYLATLR